MITSILSDLVNTNKQVRHYDESGKYIRLSVDETIANNLNAWDGWTCSAGTNGLYIDFDGNVWICNTASSSVDNYNIDLQVERKNALYEKYKQDVINGLVDPSQWLEILGVMIDKFNRSDEAFRKNFTKDDKIPGLLGNIATGFNLPIKYSICQWKKCGCGADVFLAKAKNDIDVEKLSVHKFGQRGQFNTEPNLVNTIDETKIVAMEPNFPIPYQVLWDLGRNCNYNCSYCWPGVHNRDAPHISLEVMKNTADILINDWAKQSMIRFNFGGGEPTINPNFLEFLKYLKSKDQWVLVTTNGSRPRKYWVEAAQYINSVNLSVHFEFVDEAKLIGNIEEICNHFDSHDDDHWLEIKLMSPPQFVERAINLKQAILEKTTISKLGANNRIKGVISLVPIRSLEDSGELVDYTFEQLQLLQNQ